MKILAIETSCDETAIAVIEAKGRLPAGRQGLNPPAGGPHFRILSNIVSSQVKIHRPFGGVVPNLAKRAHQENLVLVLKQTLKKANLLKNLKSETRNPKQIPNTKYKILNTILDREDILRPKALKFINQYKKPKIDFIAVTRGPGLAPALWPGVNFSRALAYAWQKPLVGVNHLEGHIAANWLPPISEISNFQFPISKNLFPVICLIVSGGHTQLILMKNFGKYKLIGETRDDAAGECFDKVARILGLGYPGGPAIAACAAKFRIKNSELRIKLPRPMINSKDYDFSFSGLKTAVLYLVKELTQKYKIEEIQARIAAEAQQAIIDVLIAKTLRAAKNFRVKTLMLSGGVASNDELRKQFASNIKHQTSNIKLLIPPKKFCTDNAAMIAAAAYSHTLKKDFTDWKKLAADANLRLA